MAEQESLGRKICLSYTYVLVWIVISCSVILYNKYILDVRMFNWPFPISLTMLHMGFCSAMAFLMVRVFRVVEPVAMSTDLFLKSVLPIGALYSLSLWFSNSAYVYLSVSFIQMLKALMPVAVFGLGVGVGKEVFKKSSVANMLLISGGVAIAAYGEANFNMYGAVLQLAAVGFEAVRLIMIQLLLTSKGISLNPITSLYYIAPTCFAFLCLPWFFVEYSKLAAVGFAVPDYYTLGFNCVCAFALNISIFLLIGKTSALTMNVAGVVKDWFLIAISWSVIRDRVTAINLFGYVLAFLGVCWYNHMKLQDMKAAASSPTSARPAGNSNGASRSDEEKALLSEAPGAASAK